ncbi:hypothetical protein GJ496_001901 [Pomphorhynchus laevis]|nr:hypothetical protein GJ496_001901 [Pomphorhynchus laevis]
MLFRTNWLDMTENEFDDGSELLKIRYSTLTTRYEDHAILKYVLAAHKFLPNQSATDFSTLLVMKRPPREILLPYSRSSDLISKSQYSLNESPGLITTLIAFLGLLGKHQFLNVARCDVDVNPYLMLAVKITSCIGTTTEIGEHFYTSEEARSGMAAPVRSKGMVLRDVARLIIRKIQSQQSTLSRRDILLLKNSTNKIAQPRRCSLAEYIRDLPLELEVPPNMNSDEFATYDPDDDNNESSSGSETLSDFQMGSTFK